MGRDRKQNITLFMQRKHKSSVMSQFLEQFAEENKLPLKEKPNMHKRDADTHILSPACN